MQISWGNKLALVFVAFAALMGTLVYKCMQQNFELVSKDYYNEELRYQDRIDATVNANQLSKVQLSQNEQYVLVQLPQELNGFAVTGEALFYCATSAANDRKIPLQVNGQGMMKIRKDLLVKDYYQLKLKWQNGKEAYYYEQHLQVK
ncbi:hypothetical protein EXU57_15070 [Segetibacter sp. 3557_3]|uniref:FixH family protein n=1 Tax=Segetibacter sp. 3557_3 TaxID=2547429 RepID=UPI00105913A3|nr:FixH family protein [Segetibacter sp. 3557_3]TDH24655.1 hypothetical protein EXU57_15070 [Segetibacter sp. 3557_3]